MGSVLLNDANKMALPISGFQLTVASLVVIAAVPTFRLIQRLIQPLGPGLEELPGPKSSSRIFGSLKEIPQAENGVWYERVVEQYGHVTMYRGLLGAKKLFTMDPKAVNYVLNNPAIYQRSKLGRWVVQPIFGHGLLMVKDDVHKRQRRIINTAFSNSQIKEMTEIFVLKSQELCDALLAVFPPDSAATARIEVNIADYLTRTTLDIIGSAGFDYSFNALEGLRNDFSGSFKVLADHLTAVRLSANRFIIQLIKEYFPSLRKFNLDQKSKDAAMAIKTIQETAERVVKEGKKKVANKHEETGRSKDMLSLLLKANSSKSRDAENTLSEEELAHQVSTFLLAGHETTANSSSFALFALACHPEMQTRLRDEIFTFDVDCPTMEQLNSLPYLDAIVHETLRYYPIITGQEREVEKDDLIPVETPYTNRYGQTRDYIPIAKGDFVYIPILLMNTSKKIWGEDAKEFNPERWINPPKAAQSIPGIWGNMLTFLGGPYSCIGFKFSIIELKAILFVLLKAFEFELAVPAEEFYNGVSVIKRPVLKSNPHGDPLLPMFLRRARTALVH